MDNALNVCGLCSKAPATVVCVCRVPGLSLCSPCILTHLAAVGVKECCFVLSV